MTDKEADSKLSRRGGHVQSGHYGHGAKHDDEQHEWSAIDWNDPDSGAIWGGGGARASDSVTADFREATGDGSGPSLPSGLALVNAELEFEEGDDGAGALVLPEGAYLKLTMPKPAVFSWGGGGWGGGGGGAWGQPAKPDDGQIHSWSMMLAVQLESLPSAPMPLLNGGMAAAMGEKVEHVQVYKNGGVGALGNMGVHAAAVRAGRWAWVSLTRSDSCLTTCVGGLFSMCSARLTSWLSEGVRHRGSAKMTCGLGTY